MDNYPILNTKEITIGRTKLLMTSQHFESPQQFVNQAHRLFTKTAPVEMLQRRGQENEYYATAQGFNGHISGYDQRDMTVKHVCDESVRAQVHKSLATVNYKQNGLLAIEAMTTYHDEGGIFFDSVAYDAGEDYCMINYDVHTETKPIITIAVSLLAASSWNSEHFLNQGVAIIQVVHALEMQGVSVGVVGYGVAEITDTDYARKHKKPQLPVFTIEVKKPHEAMDESNLINCLTNAGMARNAGFQNLYYLLNGHSAGLGIPQTLTKDHLINSHLAGSELAVLPYDVYNKHNFENPQSALAYVEKIVNTTTSITI